MGRRRRVGTGHLCRRATPPCQPELPVLSTVLAGPEVQDCADHRGRVVGALAIGGIILAVVLVNRLPDPGPVVIGDDAALNQLAQSCFDGDMGACDDLFLDSPVASAGRPHRRG